MTRTLLATLGLLAAACTTADLDDDWAKAGATPQQATRDDWECRRKEYDGTRGLPNPVVGGVADAARAWGDSRRQEATYAECMRSRGYQLVRHETKDERAVAPVEGGSVKAERSRAPFVPPVVAPSARPPESQ